MGQGTWEPNSDGLGQPGSAEKAIRHKFDSLSFSIQKNRRYHEKLLNFYGHWRDRMKIVTAVAGSGAFLLVTAKWQHYAEGLNAFIALWAVLDIVASPDKKADRSRDLVDKNIDLACKIESSEHTDDAYRQLLIERMQIERAEMPAKRLVDLEARNDECRARGYDPDDLVPLSKWQRFIGYYANVGMPRLEEWKAKRQRLNRSDKR